MSKLHKATLGRWKADNERNGSAIGAAITGFMFDEPEPNPLHDSRDSISRVPMPARVHDLPVEQKEFLK